MQNVYANKLRKYIKDGILYAIECKCYYRAYKTYDPEKGVITVPNTEKVEMNWLFETKEKAEAQLYRFPIKRKGIMYKEAEPKIIDLRERLKLILDSEKKV